MHKGSPPPEPHALDTDVCFGPYFKSATPEQHDFSLLIVDMGILCIRLHDQKLKVQ